MIFEVTNYLTDKCLWVSAESYDDLYAWLEKDRDFILGYVEYDRVNGVPLSDIDVRL